MAFFIIWGWMLGMYFFEQRAPFFLEYFSGAPDNKIPFGVFFTLLGLWLTESGVIGKGRLEAWDKKVRRWSESWGILSPFTRLTSRYKKNLPHSPIEKKNAVIGMLIMILISIAVLGVAAGSLWDGVAIYFWGIIIVLLIFAFPVFLFSILLFLPVTLPLLIYRVMAHVENDEVLERTFTLIGLLSGTVGVLLMLN